MTPEVAKKLSIAEQHHWFQQQRSRRAILKGGIAGAGTLVAGTTLLGRSAGASTLATPPRKVQSPTVYFTDTPTNGSGVVPFGRHISYGSDPTQQMNIAWQVAGPVANPFVRIGTNPFELGEQVPAVLKNVSTAWADITHFLDSVPPAASNAQAPEEQYYAHAALNRLQPGTTYYYVVGHQGLDSGFGASSLGTMASFTTAPSRATPFTFTAFGDQGITYDAVATSNLILAQSPAFHLHAGDISYAESGGSGLLTDSYDPRAWDSFFVETASTAASVPWMASLGNHEMEAWYSPDGYGADVDRFDFLATGPVPVPAPISSPTGMSSS
jgi:hypothetical protein